MKIEEIWKMYLQEPIYITPTDDPIFICPSCGTDIRYDDFHCPECKYKFGKNWQNEEFENLPEDFVPMLERPLWGVLCPDLGYELLFYVSEKPSQRKLEDFIYQTNLDNIGK